MHFRKTSLITALLIGGLYVVRADRVGGLVEIARDLAVQLDENLVNGSVSSEKRSEKLHRIALILNDAEERQFDVSQVIDLALSNLDLPTGYFLAAEYSLIRNLRDGQELGLFTPENRARCEAGEPLVATRGAYLGEEVCFEPILSVPCVSFLSANFLNMRYKTKSEAAHSRRSTRPDREALELAHSFFCAALIDSPTFAGIMRRARG